MSKILAVRILSLIFMSLRPCIEHFLWAEHCKGERLRYGKIWPWFSGESVRKPQPP